MKKKIIKIENIKLVLLNAMQCQDLFVSEAL